MTVGVLYCGGCNPRYDRVALVKGLARDFQNLQITYAKTGERYDLLLVVCGCSAACVDITGYLADKTTVVSDAAGMDALYRQLKGETPHGSTRVF